MGEGRVVGKDPEAQLLIIGEVSATLTEQGIAHWLFGGWGVDFLLQRVTRPHTDIDFFVWERDVERIVEVLARLGYTYHPDASWEPTESVFVQKRDHYVELAKLVERDDGEWCTPGRYLEWPWPKASFRSGSLTFRGVTVPAFDAAGHIYIKEGFSRFGSKEPLRPEDETELVMLRELLASESR